MNKKLIAIAVSGALAVPMVASADDSGPTLYGRLNVALEVNDTDTSSGQDIDDKIDNTELNIVDVSSRFGIKGEEDLGNGLAAIYRYEFRVNASEGTLVTGDTQRLSYVGLKGGFGQVTMGSQWSAFYNYLGTYIDPTYTLGYFGYSSFAGGDYRINNDIQYQGNFGPVSAQVDLQMSEDNAATDDIDRWQIGLAYNTGPFTVSTAYDSNEELDDATDDTSNITTDIWGLNFNYANEKWGANLGWMDNDQVGDLYAISGNYWATERDNLFLQYWDGQADADDADQDGIVFGYYHYVSDRTKLWTELAFITRDGEQGDTNRGLFGIRHDF